MHNVLIIKKERMQLQTSKLSWERMESNGGWQGEASSGKALGGGGPEWPLKGPRGTPVGRDGPQNSPCLIHFLHFNHLGILLRFWLCRSRRGGRDSPFLTSSLGLPMLLARRTNLSTDMPPCTSSTFEVGFAWQRWPRHDRWAPLKKWGRRQEPETDLVLGARS